MTPERLKKLADDAAFYEKNMPKKALMVMTERGVEPFMPVAIADVRALLAIAQRAGETCEWVPEDWANFKAAQFQTDCGRKIHSAHDRSRPCWCGRTVAVRDGRT